MRLSTRGRPGASLQREALAARQELATTGRLERTKQLGLSVALTPAEFRCEHHGDYRYCPSCGGESEEERLLGKLTAAERENERLRQMRGWR